MLAGRPMLPRMVFVSHSHLDHAFVSREILPLLAARGIATWYSKSAIRPAGEWERSILKGLYDCDWFLVVMTPRSAASEWVRDEVHWAMEHRRGRVIPVLAEECELEELHLRMPRLQSVDFSKRSDDAHARLLEALGAAVPDSILEQAPLKGAQAEPSLVDQRLSGVQPDTASEIRLESREPTVPQGKVCPLCCTVAQLSADYCPNCGHPYWSELGAGLLGSLAFIALGGCLAIVATSNAWIWCGRIALAFGALACGAFCVFVVTATRLRLSRNERLTQPCSACGGAPQSDGFCASCGALDWRKIRSGLLGCSLLLCIGGAVAWFNGGNGWTWGGIAIVGLGTLGFVGCGTEVVGAVRVRLLGRP
jgi:TIR domain